VRECISGVSAAWASCYADDNEPCGSDDANVVTALAALESTLDGNCADGEFLSLSVDALIGRLQNSCRSEADAIAWRTYGGPQGAVYPDASSGNKSYLERSFRDAKN
jgi:hypothetical protein